MALPLLTTPLRPLTVIAAVMTPVIVLLSSCEKLADGVVNEIEFPEHEPRLAVTMFVTPGDTVLLATVYQSAGIMDLAGSTPLRQSTVTLTQNGEVLAFGDSTNWGETPWEPGYAQNVMKMTLENPLVLAPGEISLAVDASPTFEPIVITETMPDVPVVDHLFEPFADTVVTQWEDYEFYNHRITVNLDNRPGARDDYMIFLEAKGAFEGNSWYSTGSGAFPDPRMEYSSGCTCLLATDNGEDNVSMDNLVFEVYAGDNGGYAQEQFLRLRVERPTSSLSNYFRSVDAYNNALGNPFAEPASIQGNIPDGFGIFGVTSEVVVPLWE